MALIEWEGQGKQIILRTDKPLYMNLPPLPDIVLVLSEFEAMIDYTSFECVVAEPVDGHSAWDYRFTHRDGRKWIQKIIINSSTDPAMTFSITDQWRLSEFKAHRRLRDVCVLLISRFGLTEFEIVRN